MKSILSFISFVSAITLASIGIQDYNNLALVGGIVFSFITVLTVLSNSKEESLK